MKKRYPKEIHHILGQGLIFSIIFNNKIKNINNILRNVCFDAMKNGLLVVYTGRESIKIGPPLTISYDALKEGINILDKSIGKIFYEK